MTDFSSKSDADLETWIANHEARGAMDAPLYRELLEERARRSAVRHRLDPERSLGLLMKVAKAGVCTTYGELAAASGVDWAQARRVMSGKGGHLDRLLDLCHSRGLPLLTALCVSQKGLASCDLEGDALKGFTSGARRLGHSITDEQAFHREQRDASWAWGRTQVAP